MIKFNKTLKSPNTLFEYGVYSLTHLASTRMFIANTRKSFLYACTILNTTLASGRHSNQALQEDYAKYGEDAFVFEILDVNPSNVKETYRAQKAATHPDYLYNAPIDYVPPRKAREKKDITLYSPEGEAVTCSSIKEFNKLHGVDYSNVTSVLEGKAQHSKGWTASFEQHLAYLKSREMRGILIVRGSKYSVFDKVNKKSKEWPLTEQGLAAAKVARDALEVARGKPFQVVTKRITK